MIIRRLWRVRVRNRIRIVFVSSQGGNGARPAAQARVGVKSFVVTTGSSVRSSDFCHNACIEPKRVSCSLAGTLASYLAMVRRRSTKPKGKSAPRPVDRKDSKMKRWETADDIPMDDEDQCTYPAFSLNERH